jgi:diguanylate cyclase (GGDEF)-like protein/PAS domain S-box-containing protein
MAPRTHTKPIGPGVKQGAGDLGPIRALIAAVLTEPSLRLESAIAEACRYIFGGESLFFPDGNVGSAVPSDWQAMAEEARRSEAPVLAEGRAACTIRSGKGLLGVLAVSGRTFARNDALRLQALCDTLAEVLDARFALERSRQDLLRSEERRKQQRQIIDQIDDSVIAMDLGGYITDWNKGAESLFGYTAEEAIGRHILFLYADENEEDALLHEMFLGQQRGREMVVRRRKKSGEVFWASLSLSLFRDTDGAAAGIVGYLADITERLRSEEQLRLQAALFEHSGEGILVTDAGDRIVSVNKAFTKITGYSAQEVIGQTPDFLGSGRHDARFRDEMRHSVESTGHWIGEVRYRRKNREPFPAWQSTSTVHNREGAVTHYFSVFTDITERRNAERQIHRLAHYDVLTGLPNRAMVHTLLRHAITEARRNQRHGVVLFIDLDRFKQVNDSLGPAVGDELLVETARLIQGDLRAEDVVAHLGGDEFVVALFDITKREHASVVAGKLLHALSQPIWLDGHEIHISASIGASVYPDDGQDPETLIRHASVAMSRAKRSEGQHCTAGHGCYLFFSQEMNRRALERMRLEGSLRKALERDELLLHFQPQLSLATGEIVGAEVLLRWNHPEMGMVPPGEFIPLAEETGLIVPIGEWTLETVCAKNKAWREAGLPIVPLGVNISARQFRPELPRQVKEMLQRTGLPPGFLELEITESVVMRNAEAVIELVSAFQGLGVGVSLDDFGTGYSSLSYLKRFPIDKLKIDQSFVRGLPEDPSDSAIARAIISLSKNLDLRVIAEGVETEAQLDFLKAAGCHEIQGYHYSRPLPEEAFLQFLLAARGARQ